MLTNTGFLDVAFRPVAYSWVVVAIAGVLTLSAIDYVMERLP